ncbi:MAG: ribbon-helix-helix protein, CopG family [Candidatus Binatus sp.]
MGALNVRIDPQTAALLERVARERGLTKSEVVRRALVTLRRREKRTASKTPYELMKHLIGSWDSGGMNLSERTGERFARMLQENKNAKRTRRRRSARRAD